jgi:hypothetical protein
MKQEKQTACLVILQGQGGTERKLVSEEVFNWINSPVNQPGNDTGWDDPTTPEEVKKYRREYEEDGELAYVTIGSCANDRALQASPLIFNGNEAILYSLRELRDFIQEHNLKVMDTFEGLIY